MLLVLFPLWNRLCCHHFAIIQTILLLHTNFVPESSVFYSSVSYQSLGTCYWNSGFPISKNNLYIGQVGKSNYSVSVLVSF